MSTNNLILSAKLIADARSFKGEVRGSKNEIRDLGTVSGKTSGAVRRTGRELDRMGREANQAAKETLKLNAQGRNMSSTFIGLRAAIATLGLGLLVRDIFQTGNSFKGIQTTLEAVAGSTEAAGVEFAFVSAEADRLGLKLETTAKGYAQSRCRC